MVSVCVNPFCPEFYKSRLCFSLHHKLFSRFCWNVWSDLTRISRFWTRPWTSFLSLYCLIPFNVVRVVRQTSPGDVHSGSGSQVKFLLSFKNSQHGFLKIKGIIGLGSPRGPPGLTWKKSSCFSGLQKNGCLSTQAVDGRASGSGLIIFSIRSRAMTSSEPHTQQPVSVWFTPLRPEAAGEEREHFRGHAHGRLYAQRRKRFWRLREQIIINNK